MNKLMIIPLLLLFLTSCGSVKHHEMLMLEDIQEKLLEIENLPSLKIQPDDILSVKVASRKPETVVAFQQGQSTRGVVGAAAAGVGALGARDGYLVDEEGKIYLPFIGEVKAAEKTISQLRNDITQQLKEYIPDASVQVRFLNFRVTILGEVRTPNTYIIPNERLTVLEAIGMAGDFTPYARRNSVLVIRQRSNLREFGRVNTQDTVLFQSPYFYLSPNDIVYVEPLKAKQYATQGDFASRYAPLLFPIVSLLTFFLGRSL
jgi:polysaccharide export outer membrane protein